MRKTFLFMLVSLDGYFEGPDHDISWFASDSDSHFEAFSLEQSKEVDTILLGHRTYDLMKSYWPTPHALENEPEIARFMNENPKVVFSHKPFEPGWKNVTVITGDVAGAVRKLKEQPGKSIAIFGSNNLCVTLMQEGLVDEFRILVNPVALGDGTPLFKGLAKKADLTLTDTRKFESGKILLTYQPIA
jgi:dihydrofolate reductase